MHGDTLVVGGGIEAGYYTASCDKGVLYFAIQEKMAKTEECLWQKMKSVRLP